MRLKKADLITQWQYWPLLFVLAGWSLPLAVSWSYIGDLAQAREPGHGLNVLIALAPMITGYAAIRITLIALRRLRYGRATLHLDDLPVVVGGKLQGHILAPRGAHRNDLFCTRLKCYMQEVRPTKEETLIEFNFLWSAIRDAQPIHEPSPGGVVVPVAFDVPPDLPVSGRLNELDTVYWCLDVWIPNSFPRFRTAFTVEVEKPASATSTTPGAAETANSANEAKQAYANQSSPVTRGLRVTELPEGGLDLLFKPRSPQLVINLGYFTLCLLVSGIGLLFVPMHPFFATVALVFAPIFFTTTTYFATWSTRLQCAPGVLRFGEGILGKARLETVPADDIAGLDLFPAVGVTDFPAYHVLLRTRQGQRVLIAKWLHSEEYAERLVKIIQEIVGPVKL